MLDRFRDPALVAAMLKKIHTVSTRSMRLMEVCGTHTAAFSRSGLRRMLPANVKILSGPGCPVCVTPASVIDTAVKLAAAREAVVLTFGDMAAVPGTGTSLLGARLDGGDVRVVTTPAAACSIAENERNKQFVFLACGFETTVPAVAAMLALAREKGLGNLTILPALRRIGPAIRQVLGKGKGIDGLICPGHVAAVTGSSAFSFIADTYGIPAVVAGFEPVDLLYAVWLLAKMKPDSPRLVNAYPRAVSRYGNGEAKRITQQVFSVAGAYWRGIGRLPCSGYLLKQGWADYDAAGRFGISTAEDDAFDCRCGEVLSGLITPGECCYFGVACTPGRPLGPCMVSGEGSCSVYYRFERCGQGA